MFKCGICSRPATYHLSDSASAAAGEKPGGAWLCDEHGREMLRDLRHADPSWGIRLTRIGQTFGGDKPGATA